MSPTIRVPEVLLSAHQRYSLAHPRGLHAVTQALDALRITRLKHHLHIAVQPVAHSHPIECYIIRSSVETHIPIGNQHVAYRGIRCRQAAVGRYIERLLARVGRCATHVPSIQRTDGLDARIEHPVAVLILLLKITEIRQICHRYSSLRYHRCRTEERESYCKPLSHNDSNTTQRHDSTFRTRHCTVSRTPISSILNGEDDQSA